MSWALAAAAVLSAVSSYGEKRGQQSAANLAQQRLDQSLDFLGQGQTQTELGYKAAIGAQEGAIGTIQKGVLDALASLDDGFAAEVRRVMDERVQASANLDQDMVGRGLYGSTAAMNFKRALSSDAQRAMGDIAARFSGDRANTFMGGAGMVAGAQSGLASLYAQRAGALSNIQAQRATTLTGAPVPVINSLAGFGQLGAVGLQGYGMYQQGQQNKALIDAIRSTD